MIRHLAVQDFQVREQLVNVREVHAGIDFRTTTESNKKKMHDRARHQNPIRGRELE